MPPLWSILEAIQSLCKTPFWRLDRASTFFCPHSILDDRSCDIVSGTGNPLRTIRLVIDNWTDIAQPKESRLLFRSLAMIELLTPLHQCSCLLTSSSLDTKRRSKKSTPSLGPLIEKGQQHGRGKDEGDKLDTLRWAVERRINSYR